MIIALPNSAFIKVEVEDTKYIHFEMYGHFIHSEDGCLDLAIAALYARTVILNQTMPSQEGYDAYRKAVLRD